jgi:hypothetical protein
MKLTPLLLLCLFVVSALAQGALAPDPGDPSHPDTHEEQLLATLAQHLDLDPAECELVFAVERTSVMTVMQGYAVALHYPAERLTVAGLVEDDMTTVEEVSYRYKYPTAAAPLAALAADGSGPFAAELGEGRPALLIGAESSGSQWTAVVLIGWDVQNNRWDKQIIEGIKLEGDSSLGSFTD